MSEGANDKGRGSGRWVWPALLLILLVLYLLSVGPAVAIARRTGKGMAVVNVVYAPIEWLHNNTPLRNPTESYVNFWDRITDDTP